MNWLIVIGLGAAAWYAYRELKRTQTVFIDSPAPGTLNILDVVA